MSKRVLVTGSNGFTGYYLKQELIGAGWEVFGLGVTPTSGDSNYYCVDLSDTSSLQMVIDEVQPHAVIHLAGIAFVGHGIPDDFYKVNLLGTRNLLAVLAQRKRRPEAVLLASSANVYGNSAEGVLTESTAPHPANDYAVSKLAMEHMARLWADTLPVIITRPFNYTGIGQSASFLLPKIVSHFHRRAEVIELGNLDVWRDFSDVRAISNAYRRLVETPAAAGATVNVCSGRTYSLREVLGLAEEITGHTMRIEVNPLFVRPNEVKTLCGNPSKLRDLIGEWDTPPLEDTLRWMLEGGVD